MPLPKHRNRIKPADLAAACAALTRALRAPIELSFSTKEAREAVRVNLFRAKGEINNAQGLFAPEVVEAGSSISIYRVGDLGLRLSRTSGPTDELLSQLGVTAAEAERVTTRQAPSGHSIPRPRTGLEEYYPPPNDLGAGD